MVELAFEVGENCRWGIHVFTAWYIRAHIRTKVRLGIEPTIARLPWLDSLALL